MSTAHQLFSEVDWIPQPQDVNEAFEKLCRAAELWRADGQHFSAGVAMSRAVDAAWGDPRRMGEAQTAALTDFSNAAADETQDSAASLAALYKLGQALTRTTWLFQVDRTAVSSHIRELNSELAQRLVKQYADAEHADSCLVRGFTISTNLDGAWTMSFPDHEVTRGIEQGGRDLTMNIPSAFHLFVDDGDWQGALEIVRARQGAFTTPGVKGWRAVTFAHIEPEKAVEWFDEAADSFGTDAMPPTEELARAGGSWSGINQQLWSKYFRARARLTESIRTPIRVSELLAKAVEALEGTESGWHSGEVSRFRVLVNVLANLVSAPLAIDAEKARREYELTIRISGSAAEDQPALTFISEAAKAFEGFATDPASELTHNRLAQALSALARIPTIGPSVANALSPAIGQSAFSTLLGPVRTWMHRSLERIKDEATLRRVFLRLLQGGLPLYAQIRHGPIEYGKDIVALVAIGDSIVLRHYQVKCGDIDKKKWRESQAEIEEMFLVPLDSFQLPLQPHRVEGFLLTNGHANPYVEPVMQGWLRVQHQDHGRVVSFMHLDGLVDWIMEHRLASELRSALQECGVQI